MNAALQATLEFLKVYWGPLLCGVAIVAILPLIVGYIVLVERKIMADMQARLGPMRVGPHGLLQPIADAVKLLIKEDIIPENADKLVFWLAPVLSVGAGLLSLAGLAIGPAFQIAQDINIGILFVVGISALGIFGIVLGGWASNSHYSLMGALRSSAQLVSYETAAGMALVSALLFTGSLNIKSIVEAQSKEGIWFVLLAPVAFFTYLVASIAETNRAPFDLPEAESELVAGYMTEFSGFRWSLYFLAEYTNMIVVASDCHRRLLRSTCHKAADTRAAAVHAGGGGSVFCGCAGARGAARFAGDQTVAPRSRSAVLHRHSRWLLVHFQSEPVHLFFHVAAIHDTAVPL
jgi:NADH-quinone oxidoreductase subunit H